MLDFHQSALSASWLGTRQRGKLSFANVCGHIRLGGCGVSGAAMPAMAAAAGTAEAAAAANQQLTSRVRPHKKVPAPLFLFSFFFPANSSSNPSSTSYVVELVCIE